MNIIEAIGRIKPFKRKNWTVYFHIVNGIITRTDDSNFFLVPKICDLTADDWEIQETTITITESQFDEAFKQGNWSEVFKDDLKKRLGF